MLSGTLYSENLNSIKNSYNNSFQVGILRDNPNANSFLTIGTTKQYDFKDFTYGMDFNVLFLGQEKFKDFGGILLTPKFGMIFIGNESTKLSSSIYVSSGISNMYSNHSNSLGFSGGVGIEARYLNYGINFGYVSIINSALSFEAVRLNLNYWF